MFKFVQWSAGLLLMASTVAIGSTAASAASLTQQWPASCQATQASLGLCAAKYLARENALIQKALLAETMVRFNTRVVANVQRNWQNYATSECTLVASTFKGGSIYPLEYGLCAIKLAQQRLAQIKSDIASVQGR